MERQKILGWEVDEIYQLLCDIKNRNQKSLVLVFSDFGLKTSRKASSVRNFFYRFMKFKDNDRVKEIFSSRGIDLNKLKANHLTYSFNKQDKHDVNGREKVEVMPSIENKMKKSDIEALFWGLVRLVKRQTEIEEREKVKREMVFTNTELNNSMLQSKKKDILINELRNQNNYLRKRVKEMEIVKKNSEQQLKTQLSTVSAFLESNNLVKLREFLKNVARKTNENKN